jgi:spore coat assembly protein SafA
MTVRAMDSSRPVMRPTAAPAGHTVRSGDTLSAIAAQQGVSLRALIAANPQIRDPNLIHPGQQVNIPAKTAEGAGAIAGDAAPRVGQTGDRRVPAPDVDPAGLHARVGGSGGSITPDELRRIVPNLSASKAAGLAPHLSNAMREANISTPRQKAAFIAQLAHESGGFQFSEEIASGRAYEGRRDLGNTQPGDGERFKGRGFIQLTGRANYTAAGKALGLDLVNNPGLAAKPEHAARVAAWFWNSRGLNPIAERGDFREVTRRINGGFNGMESRQHFYDRALALLGTERRSGDASTPTSPSMDDGAMGYDRTGAGPRPSRHTVRAGDKLSMIAERLGTTVEELLRVNPQIRNANRIYPGQTLVLPAA